MVQVELDGSAFSVRTIEPAADTARPPVVWAHGLSSSMASEDELGLIDWSTIATDRRVVRYDARGHGASDSTADPAAYRWDRLAADQLALADALGVDRYVAAGASMGCATALFAALAAPDRIDRLVLVIPPTAWETRQAQTEMYRTTADLLDAGRVDLLVAGVDAAATPDPFAVDDGDDDVWKARSRRTLRTTDPVRLARVFRGAALADLPERGDLRRIARPALILAWSGDPGHPVSTAEALADLLPLTTLHVASTPADLDTWTTEVAAFLA